MMTCAFGRRAGRVHLGLLSGIVFALLTASEPLGGGQFSAKLIELRVVGSKRYPEPGIIAAMGLKPGSTVSPADFTAAAKKLAAIGVFSSVRYRYKPVADGVSVEYQVQDVEKLVACRFGNFVWFTDEELLAALRSRVALFSGQAAPGGNQIEEIRKALEALLKERGIGGQVTAGLAGNGGPVEFSVEGAPIIVHEVALPGVTQIDQETLHRLTGAVVGGNYERALILPFLFANLKLEYDDRGYLKAKFGAMKTDLIKHDGPETWVSLTLPVEEGPQYRIAAIHWAGTTLFPEDELTRRFGLKPGDIANQGLLLKGTMMAEGLFGTRGYARAHIQPMPTFNEDQHAVSYELRVNEGSIYRMGKLTIAGLDAPTTARVEGACLLELGQVYDRSYWMSYLKSILPLLPPEYRRALPPLKDDIDDAAKTVNVTFDFAHKPAP